MQDPELPTKLPITAFVASHNEGHLLKKCLSGLNFCSEIFVINLASTDNTLNIAQAFEARVLNYPKYPIVEQALFRAIPKAAFDWILLTDPDEEISLSLAVTIKNLFATKEVYKYQAVRVPVQYYFKSKALNGTIWGGYNKNSRLLFYKDSIVITDNVHQGVIVKDSAKVLHIQRTEFEKVNHHYWMTSYKTLFEKHNRYINEEGKRLYDNGVRYSVLRHLKATINAFRTCFFHTKGYRDGLTGLFLSFFWSYYNFKSWKNLLSYSRRVNKDKYRKNKGTN